MSSFAYNPEYPVDAESWLSLSEAERLQSVHAYHESVGADTSEAHTAFHEMVETQIASTEAFPIAYDTLHRLMNEERLSRHHAIHAMACVLAKQVYKITKSGGASALPSKLLSTLEEEYSVLTRRGWENFAERGEVLPFKLRQLGE